MAVNLPAPTRFYPRLNEYLEGVFPELENIPAERRERLEKIATFVRRQMAAGLPARLVFICTHNSRRSHLGQIWAAAAARFFDLDGVEVFSGGTEVTAFNPRAVAALERAGFRIVNPGGENPRYLVYMDEETPPLECFSKKYDDPYNPQSGFAALMTCSEADQNCPLVLGAAFRVPIPYDDPKEADGTPEEAGRYDERCRQIAAEIFYLFSQV